MCLSPKTSSYTLKPIAGLKCSMSSMTVSCRTFKPSCCCCFLIRNPGLTIMTHLVNIRASGHRGSCELMGCFCSLSVLSWLTWFSHRSLSTHILLITSPDALTRQLLDQLVGVLIFRQEVASGDLLDPLPSTPPGPPPQLIHTCDDEWHSPSVADPVELLTVH